MLNKKVALRLLFFFICGIAVVLVFSFNSEVAAANINIRNESGEVTTWGWLLVNILAPFFVLFEIIKIIGGVCIFLFNRELAVELLTAGWENLTVMFPGLVVWTILGSSQ